MMTPLIRKLTPADYKTTVWSGGTTTQLWISPHGADYAARDFLWRISSAVVEDETSTFTPLPDHERYISTLEGSILLRHDEGDLISLPPYQVHRFDGGARTQSFGCCRDFNLMLRKDRADGLLEAIKLPDQPSSNEFAAAFAPAVLELPIMPDSEEILLYCSEGTASVMIPQRAFAGPQAGMDSLFSLSENEALILQEKVPALFVIGTGWLMLAQMKKRG